MKGWINIYKSGFYHRRGKPNAFDRHGGDIYATRAGAVAAIEPHDYYVDTVSINWTEDSCCTPPVNPPEGGRNESA